MSFHAVEVFLIELTFNVLYYGIRLMPKTSIVEIYLKSQIEFENLV